MRNSRRIATIAIGGLLVYLGLSAPAGTASAQDAARQTAALRLVEQEADVPTAATFDIDYFNPGDPEAKPPVVRQIVAEFAGGTRIDTGVPAQCNVPDQQLMLLGANACAEESRVGTGFIRVDTGVPGPTRYLEEDLTLLNRDGELIFLFEDRGTGARLVNHCPIAGETITCNVAQLPGTPPDGGAVDAVQERLDEISRMIDGQRRGYITTPSACPASRAWTNVAHFTYADDVSQSAATHSPCAAGEAPGCVVAAGGGVGADVLTGTPGGDRISARGGNDRVRGGAGDDCLHGGSGRDRVWGQHGSDRVHGGSGDDRLGGGPGRDVLRGGRGDDLLTARDGSRDRVRCGSGHDAARVDRDDDVRGCEMIRTSG